MPKKLDIRYGKLWVRLLCCLAVATLASNAVFFRLFIDVDESLREFVAGAAAIDLVTFTRTGEILVIVALCVGQSIIRVERPITMVACGVAFIVSYGFIVAIALQAWNVFLPVTCPVLGILGSTSFLDTMAWSEERARRKDLERMEIAKQQFTDMLVHDLKRRISSILMSISLLDKSEHGGGEQATKLHDTMRASADRMLIQINALLDIRKIEEAKMSLDRKVVSLRTLVGEVIDEYGTASALVGVRLRLVERDDIDVRVDPELFGRIIANLLWNSLQHAPESTEVEVDYRHDDEGRIVLHVANRGETIPRERQDELFSAFVTGLRPDAGSAGTGLGLAFCRMAISAHGGEIRMESPWAEHGDGVMVLVTLPPGP